MTTVYKYISSSDYINSLTFEYIDTYSFRREPDRNQDLEIWQNLRAKKNLKTITADEAEEFANLNDKLWSIQYLIDDSAHFHPSAIKTNTFKHHDQIVARLQDILRTEIKKIPTWMCAPFYRDAIVFYDNNKKIISCLNVCLSCEYMQLNPDTYINADQIVYDLLRQLFIDCGHNVEPKNASR